MKFSLLHAARAFWRTKRLARRLRTRDDVLRWRALRVEALLRDTTVRVPFYAQARGRALDDLPIVDKQVVMANFDKLNINGVSYQQVRAALDSGRERIGDLIVGQSTGTSGNRGLFVISEAERFTWLGVMLAKTLPDFPFKRHKVALALPGFSRLYASAAETGRLTLRFFDLAEGVDAWRELLAAFAPDTIVAPPKVLRILAETTDMRPRHIFSGAEVLDSLDRDVIESSFGARVREIYMATEGLFGVGCPLGHLHLAEDVVAFEFEPMGDLVTPLVTDFTRTSQVMVRYRMNDLLHLSDTPCACGSPLQRVAAIVGRSDDIFLLPGVAQRRVAITPDVVRNAVVDADRRILDFRVVQRDADLVELSLAANAPAEAMMAASVSLQRALAKAGAAEVRVVENLGVAAPFDRKLRRVRRDWSPDQS